MGWGAEVSQSDDGFWDLMPVSSRAMRWDPDGHCWEQVDGGPWERRRDRDFGTAEGDLLIDPWIQEAIRDRQSP